MDSFTALPLCSPITMAAITPPPPDHRSSLSTAVFFLCRGSQRCRHQSQTPKSHLGSKPAPPAQVGMRDIVWEWLWEWECRRI
ncbi:hypothetical protein M0R45_018727 [Rubus argutus]|uniref:Uncharacterized protein n=1 Tax=Rubus argutus TaxID=59490 RepID=A0AAW1X474_RUBAR